MKISIVVAVDEQWAIGKDNQLLCHLPTDLKMFKELTTGGVVLMGRKTFESLPNGPLPKRMNVVISRTIGAEGNKENLFFTSSIEEALSLLKEKEEVFIIGGEQIYKQGIELADYLYITYIHYSFEDSDVFFPQVDLNIWEEEYRKKHFSDEKNLYDFSFVKYKKKSV